MEKQHLDKFFNETAQDPKYEQFAIALPMTLIYRNLFNETEHYIKEKFDLSHSEIDVLAALYFNGKILSPTDLYSATVFSSGGMTKVLKKLEQRDLISRSPSPQDKRSMLVSLEKAGEDITLKCLDEMVESRKELFNTLDEKEYETLKEILKKLTYKLF